ncbi:MAG TPA: diaminopimelate epimerase [Acidimicrobiales bacterium]|nr:diaminopimelate epimerase [Acidimicrobiales bacterium]
MTASTILHLTKHHALGNDFLVLLDPDAQVDFGLEMARSLCDRHRGIGADGMIHARTGPAHADITMTLRNADGGMAEMSGNGIRCLAQAVVDAGLGKGPQLTIATGGGLRQVTVEDETGSGIRRVSVDMGPATLGPDQPQECLGRRVRTVDLGNPHLVLLGPDPRQLEIGELGPQMEALTPGGVNVEFVAVGPGQDELTMRVWERGVGETLACGTGACAAATAAYSWGLVGSNVTVHQPGGDADIELRPDNLTVHQPGGDGDIELRPDNLTVHRPAGAGAGAGTELRPGAGTAGFELSPEGETVDPSSGAADPAPPGSVILSGPTQLIARIEVDWP